jgi:hypothetical protein
MTATTLTLTDFLLARIADDEAAARDAMDRAGAIWHRELGRSIQDQNGGHVVDYVDDDDAAAHIARHDPARVLAECEAKRRIVQFHKSWPVLAETPPTLEADPRDVTAMTYRMSKQIAWTTEQKYRETFGEEPPTGPMLRALAAVYADHEDYRAEWAL